jgi:hypothetical protein
MKQAYKKLHVLLLKWTALTQEARWTLNMTQNRMLLELTYRQLRKKERKKERKKNL